MNLLHHWLCQSTGWRNIVERRVPWALRDLALGSDVLEIGPGFGVTTDFIQPLAKRLTCVELDGALARKLRCRMSGKNVTVLCENATSTSLQNDAFDAAVCFTMLHHLPSQQLQDQMLKEVARVLRPGGVFAGIDSLYSWRFGLLHVFDTMVMVSPDTFPDRLKASGFTDIEIGVDASAFRFRARKAVLAKPAKKVGRSKRALQ